MTSTPADAVKQVALHFFSVRNFSAPANRDGAVEFIEDLLVEVAAAPDPNQLCVLSVENLHGLLVALLFALDPSEAS